MTRNIVDVKVDVKKSGEKVSVDCPFCCDEHVHRWNNDKDIKLPDCGKGYYRLLSNH